MKIYDPVHGFIHFDQIESVLIDTEVFQRLRYIHQLGIAYMIYPGGTHTRFEHSLGTMHLATKIFEQIAADEDRSYFRLMVRLAALCHDLGHLPFSHVAEDWLLGKGGHEEWTLKIIESNYLTPIWETVKKQYPHKNPILDAVKLSLGKEKLAHLRPDITFSSWENIYSQIITADFFGADRIDYLLRDARATGLSYGLFDYMQLIEMLTIIDQEGELAIGMEENGVASCEALLLARHFMQRRVYQYPSARAFSFHLARFMATHYQNQLPFSGVADYIQLSEQEILCALEKAKKDPFHPAHLDALAIFDRKTRFQAISLPPTVLPSDLELYKEKNKLGDRHIYWDLKEKKDLSYSLSLLIRGKNAQIIPASAFSAIRIPATPKNWLYLAPEYTFSL